MSRAGTRADTYVRIYAQVRRIPRGRIATYGQIARLAGMPSQARLVGYALHALSEESVPWQRIINSRGEVSRRSYFGAEDRQRRLLEEEGVVFDVRGRVDLRHFRWRPRAVESRARAAEDRRRRFTIGCEKV